MWRRVLSTHASDPKKTIRELKRHVYRLYKHIHPDRLGRFPEHRAVNEASFQVLQAALERHFDRVEARTHDLPPRAHHAPQQLTFFAQPAADKGECRRETDLKKAVVRFHEANIGHGLHTLFRLLGLEPPPLSVLPGKNARSGVDGLEFSSLTQLVRHARRVISTNMETKQAGSDEADSGLDDEMLVTRLKLQRSRGVVITLGAGLPGREKLVLIFRRLAATMRQVGHVALDHLVVEIDGGFEVAFHTEGALPWITLGACASGDAWVRALSSEAVCRACEACRRRMERLRMLEAAAAKRLGVKMVLHNIRLVDEGAGGCKDGTGGNLEKMVDGSEAMLRYERLLEALGDGRMGTRSTGTKSVVVMLEPGSGTSVDVSQGVVRMGLSCSEEDVVRTLAARGAETNRRFERLRMRQEEEVRRVGAVKRAVGIGGLRRGEGVSDREWDEAVARMLGDAGRLRGVFDGVCVVVGTRMRVLGDGSVEVPFDFYRSVRM